MPIAPADLFASTGLSIKDRVRWGKALPCKSSGVYAVSLSDDSKRNAGLHAKAPVSATLVGEWLAYVPTFTLDGNASPAVTKVVDCLASFWLPDESIVYLGKATCLTKRLGQFRRHRLGDRKPHAGGHWLKTLSSLDDLWIFFCECDSVAAAEQKEDEALAAFAAQVSPASRRRLGNADMPIPFANREYPKGNRKQCRIGSDVHR